MPVESLPLVVAWCALALFLGGCIKGTLGVGTPLLTVPLMAMVLPIHLAVVLMAIPVVVANAWQTVVSGNPLPVVRRFWPVALALVAGSQLGTWIFVSLDARPLLLTVAGCVIAFTVLQYLQPALSLPARAQLLAGIGFGFVAGVVGGISSMFGPVLITYVVALHLPKDVFVKTIGFLYLSAVLPWTFALFVFGAAGSEEMLLSTAAALPVFAGVLLGQYLRSRISESRFRLFVLVVLLISGLTLLERALA